MRVTMALRASDGPLGSTLIAGAIAISADTCARRKVGKLTHGRLLMQASCRRLVWSERSNLLDLAA